MAIERAQATRCCWPPDSWRRIASHGLAEADQLEQLPGPSRACLVALLADAETELDVLLRGQVREQAVGLEDHAHVAPVGGHAEHVVAVDEHLTESGHSKPAMIRKAVVLPQPLGPEQGDELSRVDLEIEVVERDDVPETAAKPRELDGCHGYSSLSVTATPAAVRPPRPSR